LVVVAVALGVAIVIAWLAFPISEHRVERLATRLDEFMPVWQFGEHHTIEVSAPPATAFAAMKSVTADEIRFFRTLTWIRRGGRQLPESILNAGRDKPLLDVATQSGFVTLAEDAPRELVIGTVVKRPLGPTGIARGEAFRKPLPPGFAIAAMNFLVVPNASGGSTVSTETRVFGSSPGAQRAFARYWRVIYPGSAVIRRMWLRAIKRRAEAVADPTN
jgi:hypothetical protein